MHFSWEPQLLPPRHSSADRGPPGLAGYFLALFNRVVSFTFVSHRAISWRVQFFVVDSLSGDRRLYPDQGARVKKKSQGAAGAAGFLD